MSGSFRKKSYIHYTEIHTIFYNKDTFLITYNTFKQLFKKNPTGSI